MTGSSRSAFGPTSKQSEELAARDRKALAAVVAQFFANGAMTASFVARAPQLRDNIGVDVGAYGLLLTASAGVGIVASLLAGRIVHTATTRRVLAAGGVAMVVSLPLIGLSAAPATLLGGLALYVFFDTLVDISMNLQGSWLSERRATPVMNRLHGVWSAGTVIGGLGAVVANARGWTPLLHLTAVATVIALLLLLTHRDLLPDEGPPEDAEGTPAESAQNAPRGSPPALGQTSLVPLVIAGVLAVVMEALGSDWATFRLSDDLAARPEVASAALVAFGVGMMVTRLVGDHLLVRFGRRALHRASIGVAACGFMLASVVPVQLSAVVGFLLVGLGVATFMPKLYDDAARVPGRRGRGLGAMSAGMRLALLLTPGLVGAAVHRGLSVGTTIALGSLSAAAGLLVLDSAQ